MPKLHILLFWFFDDWGLYGRTYQKVAEYLARLPEVGQVVCIFPPKSSGEGRYAVPLLRRRISDKLILLTENSRRLVPTGTAPFRVRRWINEHGTDLALKAYLHFLGFRADNTVFWLFPPHPYLESLLQRVPRRFTVTHVMDNFTKFDPKHFLHTFAREQYPKLGLWSDIILTTSQSNWEEFRNYGIPCFKFDVAVDECFIAIPSELPWRENGQRPRLGYVGWIMERTDLDLLAYIAKTRPEWDIILVGPQYPEDILVRSGLLDHNNVNYQGPLPNIEVPAFLQTIDVCMIPHRDNPYSRSMSPLKLFQYLASGRPIVSTEVAVLDRVRDYLNVAASYDEFVAMIERTLQYDTVDDSAVRIEVAKNETWGNRIQQMLEVVKHAFNKKPS